jgi:hypothetical protein
MKLNCYTLNPNPPALVPSSPMRQWMDETSDRFAYRCLPLSIANSYGWDILSPCAFQIEWTGGNLATDLTVQVLDNYRYLKDFAVSHFAHGIITFHPGYLFQTEPGWNLIATGPFNQPKDGITPLTGVIETDWLPFSFTMNWKLTAAGTIGFEKDEPFCHIYPVQQGILEDIVPEIRDLSENPDLQAQFNAWSARRSEFIRKLDQRDEETMRQAWEKLYFQGKKTEAEPAVPTHQHKVRLNTPVDMRKKKR